MSWIWSSTPPSDEPLEPGSLSSTDQISIDPYANTLRSSQPSSDFGSAFSDDLDYTETPSQSFDTFSPSQSPPSFETFSTPGVPSTPQVDFNSMGRINPATISPQASWRKKGSSGVDYVFSEDYIDVRKKSATEQLTYLGGMAYLTGAAVGGSAGFVEGVRSSAGKATKLRVNAILNATGKRGALLANSMGVLALAFSLSESVVYNYTSDDIIGNYAAAGAAAGAIFKSTRGPRVAAIWAAAGAVTAVGTIYASRQGMYGRGLQGIL